MRARERSPVQTNIDRVYKDPFIPTYFGKNQKGMQAENELEEVERVNAKHAWKEWVGVCLKYASIFKDLGLHKQLANRVLESVNWHTIVCTATEYDNYFALRDNPQAAPEIRDSAHAAQELYRKNEPRPIIDGGMHLPYVAGGQYDLDVLSKKLSMRQLCMVSIGRCAAVSYMNQENIVDPDADMVRAESRLLPNGHMSPFEHVAEALSEKRWREVGMAQAQEWIEHRVPVGNIWGWLSYRKTIPGEHNFKLITKE